MEKRSETFAFPFLDVVSVACVELEDLLLDVVVALIDLLSALGDIGRLSSFSGNGSAGRP